MQSRCVSRACVLALLAMLLATTVNTFAKDGRDFAGYYNVSDVTEQGDQVQVTLRVRIFNHGGEDVKQAVVMLREPAGLHVYGVSKPIKLLPTQRDAKVSQQFTIPRHEYERWQKTSTAPSVSLVYQDSHGNRMEKTIDVIPRPVSYF